MNGAGHNLCAAQIGQSDRRLHARSRAGFTLLELIVALAIVAIMAVSLYASMRMAFNAKESADANVEPPRTAELAMEFIRNDLQSALPPHDPDTYKSQFQYMAGPFKGLTSTSSGADAADVMFCSTAEMKEHGSANGEIKEIELTLAVPAKSTQRSLVRRCSRNLLTSPAADPDEEVLCRGVAGFTVRYYDGANWNDSWDSTQEQNGLPAGMLPAAVEVTLTLDRPTPEQPQRLIRFTRIFALPMSTALDTDTTGDTTQ